LIVRILGEGQFDVPEAAVDLLNSLDETVEQAVETGDREAFGQALAALLAGVRESALPHEVGSLDSSDLILPHAEATLEEVRDLLSGDGLIPG
jgi:hypothetical protein